MVVSLHGSAMRLQSSVPDPNMVNQYRIRTRILTELFYQRLKKIFTKKFDISQNLVIYYDSVAEIIDEIISAENTPNCVGGIREFNYV
jgi:hypothetical protein